MKATYRRLVTALFCAVIVNSTCVATVAQGWISEQVTIGPNTKSAQFINDTTYALMNGLDSYGMFTSIASGGKVSIADILAYNGLGQSMYFTLAITNSTPFTLGDINLNFDSKFNSFSGTLNDFNQSYSLMGIGIGADGTVYSSGNANTPVVAAYIVGVGSSINTSGQPFPDAAISWSSVCPYDTTVSYTSGSLSTSALITVIGVPEPSTIALSALGAFGLILASRKGIK